MVKKKEILPFVTAWTDPEFIMLNEKKKNNTVREGQIPYDLTYMWNIVNKIN